MGGHGAREPAYAAAAIMSFTVSAAATARIGAASFVDREPAAKPISCRSKYEGDRPAIGGAGPAPRSFDP